MCCCEGGFYYAQYSRNTDEFNLGDYLLTGTSGKGGVIKRPSITKTVITYNQLLEAANRAEALLKLGVEEENRVMICFPDCPIPLQLFWCYEDQGGSGIGKHHGLRGLQILLK